VKISKIKFIRSLVAKGATQDQIEGGGKAGEEEKNSFFSTVNQNFPYIPYVAYQKCIVTNFGII
jgi:hypothetical protein